MTSRKQKGMALAVVSTSRCIRQSTTIAAAAAASPAVLLLKSDEIAFENAISSLKGGKSNFK